MPEKYRWTKTQLKQAAENSNGTYVSLSKQLGCKSVLTAKRWIEKYEDVHSIFMQKKAQLLDVAEDTLFECLNSKHDSVRLKAAEFVLKTVGRDLYGDKVNEDAQAKLVELVDKLITNAQQ